MTAAEGTKLGRTILSVKSCTRQSRHSVSQHVVGGGGGGVNTFTNILVKEEA